MCIQRKQKYNSEDKGRGRNVWDQRLLPAPVHKLLGRKISGVILASLLWTPLSRSPLETITVVGRPSKHLGSLGAERMQ